MAKNKKWPNKTIVYCAGNGGKSVYVNVAAENAVRIDDYRAILLSNAGEKFIATPETSNSVCVVTRKGKVGTALLLQGDNRNIEDITEDIEKFQGNIVLVYHCENTLDTYHILFCDTRNDSYKNICIDTFGYEYSDVIGTVFEILSAPYLNISNEYIQDMKPIECISDNSRQDAAPLE